MKVGIINVTGYAGAEVARILSRHEEVEITCVTGRSGAGKNLGDIFPHLSNLDMEISPDLVKTGGCVKALQYLVRRIPHFFEVYAANGLVAILGRTTCFVLQFTGNGQHGVARLFRGKATWRKTPEESIPGIGEFLPFTRLAPGGLPVCRAGHDELVQGLHAPAVLQKTHSQPIQQLRMTGRFAQGAEIIGRRHDALAQVTLPYAVHDYPG